MMYNYNIKHRKICLELYTSNSLNYYVETTNKSVAELRLLVFYIHKHLTLSNCKKTNFSVSHQIDRSRKKFQLHFKDVFSNFFFLRAFQNERHTVNFPSNDSDNLKLSYLSLNLNKLKNLIESIFNWNKTINYMYARKSKLKNKELNEFLERSLRLHEIDMRESYCYQGLQYFALKNLERYESESHLKQWYHKVLGSVLSFSYANQHCILNIKKRLSKISKISNKVSLGNRLTLIHDGDTFLTSLLADIKSAVSRVWIESYIFDNSTYAKAVVDEMIAIKTKNSCDVILLIDWLGSWNINSETLKNLTNNGIQVVVFNKPELPFGLFQNYLNLRDHRKIAIIDNVGYCGSSNISENTGGEKTGNNRFFDIHVKIEGPAVQHLAEVFIDSLDTTDSNIKRYSVLRNPSPIPFESGGTSLVHVLSNNRRRGVKEIPKVYESAIYNSESSVFLTTSYFFPPQFLKRALKYASTHGTLISMLLSGNSDVWGDMTTTNVVLSKLLKNLSLGSIRIYKTTERHCHAKFMTVDNFWAFLGSYNFDRLSAYRNLEVALSIFDPSFVKQLNMIHFNAMLRADNSIPEMNEIIHTLKSYDDLKMFSQYYYKNVDYEHIRFKYFHLLNKIDILSFHNLFCPKFLTLEVTFERWLSKVTWFEYIVYRLISWAGGVSFDQYIGPEKNIVLRYEKLLRDYKTSLRKKT